MNLKPTVVEALRRIGFVTATEVQERTIPVAVQGKDLIVRAKTGTGKTCAFLVPIMERDVKGSMPEVLIMVPTRELAQQIHSVATKLRPTRKSSVAVVYGGASINMQIANLEKDPDMVVGTPGRIMDLFKRRALRLDGIKVVVLDEADTMFDMGFIDAIEWILSKTPSARQTMLFSATMPDRIIDIARRHMNAPTHISVGSEEEPVVTKISHFYAVSEHDAKVAMLMAYISKYSPKKAIIFVQTQRMASMVYETLVENKVDAMLMHGGLTQSRREHSLREFAERGRFLVATNIAARGIDISGISDIINFDAPEDPTVYVHRVGRSARMDADGKAFTIVCHDERSLIRNIERANNIRMSQVDLDIAQFANIRLARHKKSFGDEERMRRGNSFGGRRPRRQFGNNNSNSSNSNSSNSNGGNDNSGNGGRRNQRGFRGTFHHKGEL